MTKKLINTKNLMCEELLQAVKENVVVVKECGSLEELTDLLMTTTIKSMCHIGQMMEIAEFEFYNPVAKKKENVAKKCAQLIWHHMMRVKEIKNALEAAANAEQVEEVLNSTSDYYLRAYATEEHYSFDKPINRLTPYQLLNALRTIVTAEQGKAELTLEELEQETGFTYSRRLGEEFLSGEKSLEQLNSQIESLKMSMKYGDNDGSLHGLAYAFGIAIKNKNCEELLSEIKDFVANYDAGNGNIEGKAIANNLREILYAEKVEKLNQAFSEDSMDEKALIQKNRENHYCATDTKSELFNLNDDSCLTADYKGYQRVLAHDKAVIEQCQTPEDIQAKLLTVDKGSIVGIAHACGMTEKIRNYKKLPAVEIAKICAQKIFEARTISHAI